MKLLLDTHVLIWCLSRPSALRADTRDELEDPDNLVLVSTVSAWEMEIKRALGKLKTPPDLEEQLRQRRFTELPVHLRHVRALRDLPPLHRDPFDRMLVCQALVGGLTVVTPDADIARYPVRTLW